jgi:hypothetical protein
LLAIVEPENAMIRLFDVRGDIPILVHQFGSFGRAPGQFVQPGDVKLCFDERLIFVLDPRNRRIQVFAFEPLPEVKFVPNLTRLLRTIDLEALGAAVQPPIGQMIDPLAIERDAEGRLYLLDGRSARVLVFDRELRFERAWGGVGLEPGRFRQPTDLALAPDGRAVLVVDSLNQRVQRFDPQGVFQAALGAAGEFERPFSACVDARGFVYVSDAAAHRIHKLAPDGSRVASWGAAGVGPREFFKPAGVKIDGRGRLFVLDWGNHRAQILSTEGEFEYAFGARLFVQPTRGATRRGEAPPSSGPSAPASAPTPNAAQQEVRSNGGRFLVRFATDPSPPPLNDYFRIRAQVMDPRAPEGAPELTLRVDAAMPEHQHGMNTQPRVRRDPGGGFIIEGMLFHMSGYWELYFDITSDGVTERAQVPINLE